jgi:hypothetical protein
MRKFAYSLSIVLAFGAGMLVQSLPFDAPRATAASMATISPEAIQSTIDARTLPETRVQAHI